MRWDDGILSHHTSAIEILRTKDVKDKVLLLICWRRHSSQNCWWSHQVEQAIELNNGLAAVFLDMEMLTACADTALLLVRLHFDPANGTSKVIYISSVNEIPIPTSTALLWCDWKTLPFEACLRLLHCFSSSIGNERMPPNHVWKVPTSSDLYTALVYLASGKKMIPTSSVSRE